MKVMNVISAMQSTSSTAMPSSTGQFPIRPRRNPSQPKAGSSSSRATAMRRHSRPAASSASKCFITPSSGRTPSRLTASSCRQSVALSPMSMGPL